MTLFALAVIGLGLACLPLVLTIMNMGVLQTPPMPAPTPGQTGRRLAVLVPARNEEAGIEACVRSVLASRGVEIEMVVMDDHSSDRTGEIVRAIQAEDGRVRVANPPPLPDGWSGKQHACWRLAKETDADRLLFLDADVRLEPEGAARLLGWMEDHDRDLVSGVPRQIMRTPMERIVVPMINFLLLGYLPMAMMRATPMLGFAAGCGQMMLVKREAYDSVGGHEAVKSSFHDGLKLPRAFRAAGRSTDLVNGADLARVRMYDSAAAVWSGFAKNATEGMATPVALPVWSTLLLGAYILPWATLLTGLGAGRADVIGVSVTALLVGLATRLLQAWTVREPAVHALWHGVTVLIGLAIQWSALIAGLRGHAPVWRGRARPSA